MGCFVTFEGPEGSGKTTQLSMLHRSLLAEGYEVLLVREPGGTPIGDQIRQVLHDVQNVDMTPEAEVLLYSASRAQLVRRVIIPALAADKVVLCDRYADSTIAYQGYGHHLDLEALQAITRFATEGLRPDLIVYLDVQVEDGLHRKKDAYLAGKSEWNRMDQQALAFHRRVHAGYLELAAAEPHRWFIVDASGSIDTVQRIIDRRVRNLLATLGIRPGDNEPAHCA